MTQTPLLRQQKGRTSETGSLRRWLEVLPSSCPPAALDPEPLPCPAPRVPPGLKQPPSRRVVSKSSWRGSSGSGPSSCAAQAVPCLARCFCCCSPGERASQDRETHLGEGTEAAPPPSSDAILLREASEPAGRKRGRRPRCFPRHTNQECRTAARKSRQRSSNLVQLSGKMKIAHYLLVTNLWLHILGCIWKGTGRDHEMTWGLLPPNFHSQEHSLPGLEKSSPLLSGSARQECRSAWSPALAP